MSQATFFFVRRSVYMNIMNRIMIKGMPGKLKGMEAFHHILNEIDWSRAVTRQLNLCVTTRKERGQK